MKGNLGSEVRLRVETLSKGKLATTNSLRAPAFTWFARRIWPDRAITTCHLHLNRGIRGKRR
jgi:hypothetical protein